MKIQINQFGGVAPKIPARYLQDNQAQVAINCPTWLGSLQPVQGTSLLQGFDKSGTISSIYRFGQNLNSDTQYWFHWTGDVDVVRGFINGDTSERTYFTGDGVPKVTDNSLALSGGGAAYPINAYQLGVPKPTISPICVVGGTPQSGAVTETRTYTYTFVNSWDEESAPFAEDPMPAVATVDVKFGETVTITMPTGLTGAYDVDRKRIYRATNGVYLFVAEVPLAQATFVDTIPADELAEELPSLTWEQPPADLAGLTAMQGGFLAGFSGIDVYFSEPYRPFAWPIQYQQSVGYPVVGLAAIDTTLAVLTKGKPSFIQGASPDGMVVVEADISQACVSKDSIVSMNGMVYYASPDGLVALAPGGSAIVTEQLFLKPQWQSLKPESIKGFAYEDRYIGFYDTGSQQGGFIYDTRSKTFTFHDMYATGGYSDLRNDTLYLVVGNKLHKWESGSALTYTWKSKKFTLPDVVSFTCFRVNAEAYPVNVKVYRDGALHHEEDVSSREIKRLPVGYGHDWEIELSGSVEVFNVEIGQSPRELSGG